MSKINLMQGDCINQVHNKNWLNNNIPDKSVQLIIADPPYFEVKGEFDFIWDSFEAYLQDVERWAVECKRVLADNGTLFWYGDAKKIAYTQVIFDNYFGLLNSLVWENTNDHKQQIRFNNDLRTFAPLTERILMYSNEGYETNLLDKYDYQIGLKRNEIMLPIIQYLNKERERANLSINEINKATNTKMGSMWFTHPSQWQLPTEYWYNKLKTILGDGYLLKPYENLRKDYEDLRKDYEELRKDYEELRRPFNNFNNYGDVIRLPNYQTSAYNHPTIKPEKLTRALILTSSRKNDLVLVPFAGSGTECAMAIKEGRNFIGYEIEPKYCEMANKRIESHKQQQTLF